MTDDRRLKTEDRRRKTEDGRPVAEDGRRKTGGGRRGDKQIVNCNKIKMKFKFEKLLIWQDAMNLGEQINGLTNLFPDKELYNLSSQIRRAADSVALNISEGAIGQSNLEQKKFIGYSIRSLAEVVTCLHKAKLRKYITEDDFTKQYDFCFKLMNVIIAFKNRIN